MNAANPVVPDAVRAQAGESRSSRFAVWLFACAAVTMLLTGASLVIGTSSIRTSIEWLLSPDAQTNIVLWHIRLPRAIGAWFAGALLGLGGAIAQGLFRNPLAEPYLLGSASGAALGVTIGLLAADASLSSVAWTGE
jgi:iron complex transport system permease protein